MNGSLIDGIMWIGGNILRPLVYFMLALPAAVVVITSFTAGERLRFPPEGLSLRWYYAAFENQAFMSSLMTSFQLALVATIGATVLGLAAAFALDHYQFRGKETFRMLTLSPLIVPVVVLGLGLLQFFSWLGWSRTLLPLLIGHILITTPYVVRTLTASLVLFDRTYEQAAMNLRATPATVLRRITLPLLAPALVTAAVFAFVTSFGNVTLSVFLGFAGHTTLPVQIFTYLEQRSDPSLAAVSTIVIIVTLLVIAVMEKMTGVERVT